MKGIIRHIGRLALVAIIVLSAAVRLLAQEKEYPDKPNPPRLVNDYAHLLSPEQAARLEQKLDDYANTTSTQITIVTMSNLGGHDISEYSVHVFNDWGLGQAGKNNGVLMLVALDDGYGKRKAWITVGRGLQGVLTDARSGQIFRNQMVPPFREKDYYKGLSDASDAIIAVTKGEYKGEEHPKGERDSGRHIPIVVIIIILVIVIIATRRRGGGGGGGGLGDLATGMLLGNMLGGGFRGGGGRDSGGGFGGFGGFGGGSTDGGGAGGSW